MLTQYALASILRDFENTHPDKPAVMFLHKEGTVVGSHVLASWAYDSMVSTKPDMITIGGHVIWKKD